MEQVPVLPEEVWKKIINMLTGCDERLAAYNTCQMWRSFLEKSRFRWMFQDIFPLLFKYLPNIDILNGRLVCKQWNKAIISYLESGQPSVVTPGSLSPFKNWQPVRAVQVDLYKRTLETYLMESERNISLFEWNVVEKFQTDFSTAGVTCVKNPFVSRSLVLPSFSQLDSRVLDFLDTFGVHLWSLNISVCPPDRTSFVPIVSHVFHILRRVPNLKKLILNVTHYLKNSTDHSHMLYLTNQQTAELEHFLSRRSVPRLHQLNNLELKVGIDLLDQVLKTAYAPQLQKFVHYTPQNLTPNLFTNLEELVWDCDSRRVAYPLQVPLTLKNMPLKRLHIRLRVWQHMSKNCVTPKWLKAIESVRNSLECLSLDWQCCKSCFSASLLDLPFVQELHINTRFWFKYFDFSCFAKLKSLRKLKCAFETAQLPSVNVIWEEERRNWMENVLFDKNNSLECDRDGIVRKGNIWQLLPVLDQVKISEVRNTWNGKVAFNDTFARPYVSR